METTLTFFQLKCSPRLLVSGYSSGTLRTQTSSRSCSVSSPSSSALLFSYRAAHARRRCPLSDISGTCLHRLVMRPPARPQRGARPFSHSRNKNPEVEGTAMNVKQQHGAVRRLVTRS